jgi:trehalose/maltose hydrolase-like predicted phosphorylase
LIGLRIGRDGTGSGPGLHSFAISSYQAAGEEKLLVLPSPLVESWTLAVGSTTANLSPAEGYSQMLDMRTGILRTAWNQQVAGLPVDVVVQTALDPHRLVIAERWEVDSPAPVKVTYSSPDPGEGHDWNLPTRPNGFRFGAIRSIDAAAVECEGQVESSNPVIGVQIDLKGHRVIAGCSAQHPLSFTRVTRIGRSPRLKKILLSAAVDAHWLDLPPQMTFDQVAEASELFWKKRWETDIEIDGPVADQQAVRSFLFYLTGAIQPGDGMSVGPFGISNGIYNGHIFWDADVWVFPVLALLYPQAAREIARYRIDTDPAKPRAGKPFLPAPGYFPWESSVSGHDETPQLTQQEIHIGGDAAWMLHQASLLGLVSFGDSDRVAKEVDRHFRLRASKNERGELELQRVLGPDENHLEDNDLFTNLLAQWLADGESWRHSPASPAYKLPRDSKSLLTYDNDPVKTYKQAAGVLSIYPLQYPEAEANAETMMNRFEGKIVDEGPAMSDSVHAIIWARLGKRGRAYQTWLKGWQPFCDNPLSLFSEKRALPVTYFTTGAAGCLQTVLYGFLGFRLDSKKEPGSEWAAQLNRDNWLSIKPNLPPAWKSVTLKNFTVLGKRYTLKVTPTVTQVHQGD